MSVPKADDEKYHLSEVIRMMDEIHLERSYAGLGSAAKMYRDSVIIKLFKVVAGEEGDVKDVMNVT
jgi:hypothetical protein